MVNFIFQIGLLAAYVLGGGLSLWEIFSSESSDIDRKKIHYIIRAISVIGFIVFGILAGLWGLYIPAIIEFLISAGLIGSKVCKSSSSSAFV